MALDGQAEQDGPPMFQEAKLESKPGLGYDARIGYSCDVASVPWGDYRECLRQQPNRYMEQNAARMAGKGRWGLASGFRATWPAIPYHKGRIEDPKGQKEEEHEDTRHLG